MVMIMMMTSDQTTLQTGFHGYSQRGLLLN